MDSVQTSTSLQCNDHGTGNCVRNSMASAQLHERVAERVKGSDHVRPRRSNRIHVVPLRHQAIRIITCLDDVDVLEAGPFASDVLVSIEELLSVRALLESEPY